MKATINDFLVHCPGHTFKPGDSVRFSGDRGETVRAVVGDVFTLIGDVYALEAKGLRYVAEIDVHSEVTLDP